MDSPKDESDMEKQHESAKKSKKPMARAHCGEIEQFPNDLTVEIFSRLPSKSVARFCTLSKHWLSTLRSPDFSELFLARSSTRPRLLFAVEQSSCNKWQFYSTPQPQNHRYEKSCHVDFHAKFSADVRRYICSYVSGLFYFHNVNISEENSPLICNPITGMHVSLPDLRMYRKSRSFLGFDPIDKQFKVMCEASPLCQYWYHHNLLTLGFGEPNFLSNKTDEYSLTEGICIDGVLYYLARTNYPGLSMIVCFDVRSEEFDCFMTECFSDKQDDSTRFRLVNYKGKLCGIDWKCDDSGGRRTVELCLWVLEDAENKDWVKYVYTLPVNEVLSSYDFSVVGVTANGDIVLVMKYICKPFYVFYFDPERNTLQSVEIQGFGADLETLEDRCQVYAFLDHVEVLSLNTAKQLKSSICQVKDLSSKHLSASPLCNCSYCTHAASISRGRCLSDIVREVSSSFDDS